MSQLPLRPTHTGSARTHAAKAPSTRTVRPPTHQRQEGAAVALDPPTKSSRAHLVRWARRPLLLSEGKRALALRQDGAGPIQVLVQKPSGQKGWRVLDQVLNTAQLNAWLREGFCQCGGAR